MVYLVGAGPGDEGLLTRRGAAVLERADVVVYDALVQPGLLALAPAQAERIYGGKRAAAHAIPQDQLNRLLVEKAQAGKTVVRLKGGDPYLFGRGGEEAVELAEAGVAFEVVPGVSSVTAALNYAGIPLTHRDHCSGFTVVTGHEDPTKPETSIDYAALAKAPGTLVILMGVERLREISGLLIAAGKDPQTPAAMVQWGTTPRQRSVDATLSTLADVAEKAGVSSPAIIVVGGVVRERATLNWFEHRPLHGRRVVVTRTRTQASELGRRLRDLGADVLEIPTLRMEQPQALQPLVECIVGITEYNWLVFTSPHGVTTFFETFFKAYPDIRSLGGLRIAAVGPATTAKLAELHLQVDAMPEQFVAAKIADAIGKVESVENLRFLVIRPEETPSELARLLEDQGGIVDEVASYRTLPETADLNGAAARFVEEGADWITFASGSAVQHFHQRFDLPAMLRKFATLRTLSIGPETSKALQGLGLTPTAESRVHTIDGLVETLVSEAGR
jgi:uroporphyrinogen III methyltransferase/synthase